MFNIHLLTLFPEMFPGPLGVSLVGGALQKGLWSLNVVNIRDFAEDKYKTVDDYTIGGGSGMVLKPDVVGRAIESCANPATKVIYMSPRGSVLTQKKAQEILASKDVMIICGRFEGIDQRVLDHYNVEEISIGDYVLSGGEIPAMALIDVCVRLIPGVLGNIDSKEEESFGLDSEYENLLEYDHYTKPNLWKGHDVPEILFSGDHGKVAKWRLEKAKELTKKRRPDLSEKW